MNTKNLKKEKISQKVSFKKKESTFKKVSSIALFLATFLFSASTFAQDQFLWTGAAGDQLWTTPGNWVAVPNPSGAFMPTSIYPGQVSPKNDVAIFTSDYNGNCIMDKSGVPSTALRVGGIIVKGYTGTIFQDVVNRFNVSAVNDAGGDELPDFTVQVSNPILGSVDGMMAWQAHFEFGGGISPTNGFQGNPSTSVGTLDYTLLFAVPLNIIRGTFKAPKDETWIRHDMFVDPIAASDFNNDYEGVVVLGNTNNGGGIRNYTLGGVTFWDLNLGNNGAVGLGAIKEFSGGISIVENNFTTGGLNGVPGLLATHSIIMNAPVGTEIHIKKDLIIGNQHATTGSMVYAAADAYGDMFLVMNGDEIVQKIFHIEDNLNFSGNLPSLRINKPVGSVVELHGPTTVNNRLELVSGLVVPNPAGTPTTQSDLGLANDMFVINSNTTVSSTDISYCTGPIRARTGKTLELPLGKSVYRPAIIRPVSGVGADNSTINMYTAEYFEAPISPSTPPSSFENPPLDLITNCEMWAIDKEDDTAADPWTFNLELSFDPSSCSAGLIYDDTCKVAVSRWDQSDLEWKSHGNDAAFTTASNGDQTVRTSLAIVSPDFERSLPTSSTTPDLFTFGKLNESACIAAPCAVDVCVDYCQEQDSFKFAPNILYGSGSAPLGIFWDFGDGGTSTEYNPVHGFPSDGVYMVTVNVYAVNDGDTCSTTYTFGIFNNSCTFPITERTIQNNPTKIKDAKNVRTTLSNSDEANVIVTPNPSNTGFVQFNLETSHKGNFNYIITNNLGQNILTGNITPGEQLNVNTTKLTSGSYIFSVQVQDKKVTQQFMVLK